MAKKPPLARPPRIKIPIDRQTPRTGFGDRQAPPVTRLPPAPKPKKKEKP